MPAQGVWRNMNGRTLIAIGSMLLYALIYLIAYPHLGLFAAAFNAIPAAVFGGIMGVRGGVFYLVIALPTNILLFSLSGSANNELITHVLGIGTFTLASVLVGWVVDLRGLNDRIKRQALELETERQLLQEEIARRTRAEEKLAHEALHDPLTDLPNRRLFFNRLEHAHAWCKQNPHHASAVLYLDLDNFKSINDSMGHKAGDDLLRQVTGRLRALVREIDTVGRLGGDEFAILIEAASTTEEVRAVIQRIQVGLALPYELHGSAIVSGASIGVVMNIAAYQQLDDILRDADSAMYQAKVSGGNQYRLFDGELRI